MPIARAGSRRFAATLVLLSSFAFAACGGSDSTGPNDDGNNNNGTGDGAVSAKINGGSWSSTTTSTSFTASTGTVGFSTVGYIGSQAWAVVVSATGITGPGTYAFNLFGNPSVFGVVSNSLGQGWSTSETGGGGTLTISSITATHVTGSFSFTAGPTSGSATGTVSVTQGTFNIAINGSQ